MTLDIFVHSYDRFCSYLTHLFPHLAIPEKPAYIPMYVWFFGIAICAKIWAQI